jgi:uncharacterized membrane protein
MLRAFYALILGLVGAGIVHISILLLLPSFSERDAWSRLTELADLYGVASVDTAQGERPILRSADPLFTAVACRFDLRDGIAHVQADTLVPFWSASVYDRNGQNVYSFNDRTSLGAPLDFAVMTPAQIVEVQKELPVALESAVFVEAPIDEGIMVVRAFIPDSSWTRIVRGFLRTVTCSVE